MKKFFQKYFLKVADRPFKSAFWTAVLLFAVLLIARAILGGVPAFSFSADMAFFISVYAFLFFVALNLIVPAIFITFFYPEKRRIVITKFTEDYWTNYSRPVWGKIPYVEIIFPIDWDITDDIVSRQLKLEIIFKINSKTLAFLNIKTTFYFSGNFQAADLAEMIRQQGNGAKGKNRVDFKSCLQVIVSHFLSDRWELIRDDLISWQQKTITTRELKDKWFTPEIIFQNLFVNVYKIEMSLAPPEIKKTHEK
jgi:hypothetical protein